MIRQPPRIERGASGAPALATVEEGSVPSTPSTEATEEQTYVFGYNVSLKWHKIDEHSLSKQTTAEYQPKRDPTADSTDNSDLSASETAEKRAESGSDSAGKKSKGKDTTKRTHNDADETPRPKAVQPKRSYTSLASIKAKSAAEPTSRKMTVETETVSSTGPSTLAGVTGDRNALNKGDAGGSLRLRPSNETIRPKKEKKKTRKAPSINSGTGRFPDAVPSPLGFHHHLHHSHSLESVRPDLRPWSQTSPTLSHFPGGADFAAANLQSYWAARFPSPESNFSYMNFLSFNFNSKIYTSNGTDHILRKASSKADIFEAKVASAVDDVNSSDSDETFVYESNPPESQPRRSRHHSRTPSATSLATIGDPRLARNLTNVLNAERGVSGKRSMKFANNPYSSSGADDDQLDRPDGTLRGGTVRPSGGSGAHHLHMTRHTRPQFEEESPFTQASKRSGAASRQSSRPTSPRIVNFRANGNGNGTPRKNEGYASYDLDADGADDERTPLIGTVRTPRGQRGSRVPANIRVRHMERFENPRSYWLKRFAGCAVMTIMVTAVVFGAVGFFFVTTKPLYEVDVKDIRNVLASEQELMVDLLIEAINPNLLTISVADMDVNVFAKSKHVGSEKWWRDHGKPPPPPMKNADRSQRDRRSLSTSSSHWVDTSDFGFDWPLPDDPDEMPEGDPQMMLLGRVLHFDNALTFDGSPIKRHLHYSVGEFRVTHPGNKTEAGGTERWERVLQDKFQLIVRGILKYNLPLSTHVIAAPIDASAMVHPEKGVDDHGRMVVGRTRSRKYPSGGDEHSPFISHDGQGVVWHGRDKDGRKEKDDKKEHMKAEEKKDREHDELEVDIPVPAERERHLRSARFNNVQA